MSNLIKFAKVLPRKVHFRARPHHFHRINHRHFCSLFHLMQYAAAMIFGETSPDGIFRRNVAIPTYPALPLYRKFPEFLRKIEPRHKMLPEIPQLLPTEESVWCLYFPEESVWCLYFPDKSVWCLLFQDKSVWYLHFPDKSVWCLYFPDNSVWGLHFLDKSVWCL